MAEEICTITPEYNSNQSADYEHTSSKLYIVITHPSYPLAMDRAHVKKTNKLYHQAGPTMESTRKKESGKI